MSPLKPQQGNKVIEFTQWVGLVVLIMFVHRHFGPEAQSPITPSVVAVFAIGVFLLLGPIPLRFKE